MFGVYLTPRDFIVALIKGRVKVKIYHGLNIFFTQRFCIICSFRWRYFKVLWHRKQKRGYCCAGRGFLPTGAHLSGLVLPQINLFLHGFLLCNVKSWTCSNLYNTVNWKSTNELVFTLCLLYLLEYENITIGNAGFSVLKKQLVSLYKKCHVSKVSLRDWVILLRIKNSLIVAGCE